MDDLGFQYTVSHEAFLHIAKDQVRQRVVKAIRPDTPPSVYHGNLCRTPIEPVEHIHSPPPTSPHHRLHHPPLQRLQLLLLRPQLPLQRHRSPLPVHHVHLIRTLLRPLLFRRVLHLIKKVRRAAPLGPMDPRRRRLVHLPINKHAGRRGEADGCAEVFWDLELELAGLAGEGLEVQGRGRVLVGRRGGGVVGGSRGF